MDTRRFKDIREIVSPETLIFPHTQQFFVLLPIFVNKLARYPPLCTQLERNTLVTRVFHATLKC